VKSVLYPASIQDFLSYVEVFVKVMFVM